MDTARRWLIVLAVILGIIGLFYWPLIVIAAVLVLLADLIHSRTKGNV
jgi:hypothetical protein